MKHALFALSCLAIGCSGAEPKAAPPPSLPSAEPPPKPAFEPPGAVSSSASVSETPPTSAEASAPAKPKVTFPPPPIPAPYPRTQKPGDGTFAPLPEGTPADAAVFYKATVHTDRVKPHPYAIVVAFLAEKVRVGLVAGTQDPESEAVPPERRTGLVPSADVPSLLAVWNGGFKRRHGEYGMRVGADLFVPPVEDACTIGLDAEGRVQVGPWASLSAAAPSFVAFRQTPPCLVQRGEVNPDLAKEHKQRTWGAAEKGERDIRRSALGRDETGQVLYYGFGDWVTATDLARTLRAAGATDVAELDVNWSYPRFFWFEPGPDGRPQIAGTFVPKITYSVKRYVDRAWERDFFYATRR